MSVIGCGYLGAVHAACMAKLGHDVVGIDVDEAKVASLAAGQAPFFEPGLPELLAEVAGTGRLRFTTDIAAAQGSEAHFLCVGTPQKQGEFAADLRYVESSFEALAPYVSPGDVVIGKSTVPVGTAERLADALAGIEPAATLVWNPEFLREGFAIKDTLTPDRLVYGVPTEDHPSVELLDEIYAAAIASGTPRIVADLATAQLVKVAANSFLATKISFITPWPRRARPWR